MTTLVSLRAEFQNINIILAILINVVIVYVVLRLTKRLEILLGPGGIAILKKVFGIIFAGHCGKTVYHKYFVDGTGHSRA
ncbi:MAG: hypothetical protein U5M51_02760 [Emticicia sp.]|nr:hypothetical protein [Emticicia sp.]